MVMEYILNIFLYLVLKNVFTLPVFALCRIVEVNLDNAITAIRGSYRFRMCIICGVDGKGPELTGNRETYSHTDIQLYILMHISVEFHAVHYASFEKTFNIRAISYRTGN